MTIPLFLSQKNDDDSSDNDGYVYGQNVLGADKKFKEWVLLQTGYITTKEQDKNGDISETNGILFRKICKKKRKDRERVIAKANEKPDKKHTYLT